MPKGYPKNGLWRGQEPRDEWVRREQAKAPLCGCGCGEQILVKKEHRRRGIPKFILGHHTRVVSPAYKGVDKWVDAEQGKHVCQCGCGGQIRIRAYHHSCGIPRYLPNHSPPPSLGFGPDHPSWITDRSKVRSRQKGQQFNSWVRKEIRRRAGDRCRVCGATDDLELDHITPISLGGQGVPENGQLLCRTCHREKTSTELALQALMHRMQKLVNDATALAARVQRWRTHYDNRR